jgi:hypothetical protein
VYRLPINPIRAMADFRLDDAEPLSIAEAAHVNPISD